MKKSRILSMRNALFATLIMLTLSFTPDAPKRVIFFGDSITELGVNEGGYITLMGKTLAEKGVGDQFELIGAGTGGNKVYDLYLRLDEDVLSKKPDLVFIYVGINDVWHKSWGTGTDEPKFKRFYEALITKIQASGAEVVLCTPTVIGERKGFTNPQDGDLNQYAEIIRQLADGYNTKLCDLRRIFLEYENAYNPENKEKDILTYDRVHLNDTGNQMVAAAMLKFLSQDQ
ncbi:MAG: GDSL-type esterase/lipase family protein [Lentimicrobium sp.]|jgi:lysophospholipase L1-like esterase|nr:GDSL-type esterase/lipase family protein [Lentimicrobium sp.]